MNPRDPETSAKLIECPTCEGRREFCVGYYSDGSDAWVKCPTCSGKGATTANNPELWRAGTKQ